MRCHGLVVNNNIIMTPFTNLVFCLASLSLSGLCKILKFFMAAHEGCIVLDCCPRDKQG